MNPNLMFQNFRNKLTNIANTTSNVAVNVCSYDLWGACSFPQIMHAVALGNKFRNTRLTRLGLRT